MVKQNFLTKMLLLCALIVGSVSSAWAEETTIASFSNSNHEGWTINGNPSYSNSGGYQLVESNMSIVTPSITWSNYTNITITIKARKYGGPNATQGKISVTQGDTELTTVSPTSTSLTNYGPIDISPTTGKIIISCPGASSSKGCGISEIIIKGSANASGSYTVTYDANGATSGTVPTDNTEYNSTNNTVTVLGNTGNLAKTGYTFSNWNTKADGTGTNYDKDDTFTITANTTLYAQWTANTYNVTLPTADTYGTYTMNATNPVAYGTEVTLTYTPASGYENYDATWNVNGSTISGNTFTMPAEAVTVTVSVAEVVDYATLPFNWEGGASADLKKIDGLTLSGNGSDYNSDSHSPYLIKFDDTGDYIQIKTDSQPDKVTIGVKMIGGGNASTITVQGSSDGETFTNVENLTISGAQYDELTLETTNAFAATDRYVRLLFNKGSNVGVGPISITKYVEKVLKDIALSGEYPTSFVQGKEFSYEGLVVTAIYEDDTEKVVTGYTISEPDMNTLGQQTITVSYTEGGVTKTAQYEIEITEYTQPTEVSITNWNNLFGTNNSGKLSGEAIKTYEGELENVSVVYDKGTGSNMYMKDTEIRLYNGTILSFEAPDGYAITKIVFTGTISNDKKPTVDVGTYDYSSKTWTGVASRVIYTGTNTSANIATAKITLSNSTSVKIADSGYTTLSAACGLDFANATSDASDVLIAYIIPSNNGVKLNKEKVDEAAAGTGILLKGTPGATYSIPVKANAAKVDKNLLKAGPTEVADDNTTIYLLKSGEFRLASAGTTSVGKAYLELHEDVGAPALSIDGDGDTTGIQNIERTINDNQYYTLDGRRVAQPTKGLYIVNGKKVVIK